MKESISRKTTRTKIVEVEEVFDLEEELNKIMPALTCSIKPPLNNNEMKIARQVIAEQLRAYSCKFNQLDAAIRVSFSGYALALYIRDRKAWVENETLSDNLILGIS